MPRRTRTDITTPEAAPTSVIAEAADVGVQDKARLASAPEMAPPMALPKPPSGKLGQIHGLIAAPDGATIEDLVASTGWQPHTIRAAVCRLRRRGLPVVLATDADGRKAYRLDVLEG